MDFLTLIIIVLLISGTLLLILYPLWQATQHQSFDPTDRVQQLQEDYQARYEVTLANIKQLMLDYEAGKLSTADFDHLLEQTKLEAAKIRQQIDYLHEGVSAATEFALNAKAEMFIKQMKANLNEQPAHLLRQVEAEIDSLKSHPVDLPASLYCPHCGQPGQPGDAFCTACGQPLTSQSPRPSKQQNFCSQCGKTVQVDDAFCATCGATLQNSTAEPANHATRV